MIEGKKIFGGFWSAVAGAGTMNPFKTWAESAKDLRKEIAGLEEDKKRFIKYGSDTSSIDTGLAALKKKLEFAKYNQRQQALVDQGSIDPGREGRSLGRPGAADGKKGNALLRALGDPDAEKKRAAEAEKYLEQLAAIKTAKNERALAEFKKEADAIKDQSRAWVDLIDPVEKYRRQLEEIDRLELVPGGLTKDQATEARFHVNEQIDGLNKVQEDVKEIDNFARDMGLSFTSAFEDAVIGGKKFSDVLKGLAQDIIRIALRKTVTEKAGNAVGDFFGGFDFGKIFGFADGGDHRGGLRIVGERGPELEATGPARIFNANQTRDILSGGRGDASVVIHNINVDSSGSSAEGDSQKSKQLGVMMGNAMRGVIVQEKRPGGLLA